MFSLLVSCAVSALAWAFSLAWFLTIPAALLTVALFGPDTSMTNRPLPAGLKVVARSIVLYFGRCPLEMGKE
jgi:hypothetical protein